MPVVAASSLGHCRTLFHSLQRFWGLVFLLVFLVVVVLWVVFFFLVISSGEQSHLLKVPEALLKQAASKPLTMRLYLSRLG